ncbi:ATP-binding protein [Flavobacteriaceae sp. LMIT009]
MSQKELDILKRALARERNSRKAAEKILEKKSTELYEVNKKLEQSHEELTQLYSQTSSQLQGVFENIVDAYVISDLKGNILKLNDAALRLLDFENGYSNMHIMDLIDPSDFEKTNIKFEDLLNEGSITDFIIKINTNKKVQKLVHVNASIIYKNGVPIAMQGIVRDITLDREKSLTIEMINEVARSILGKVDIYEIAWEITGSISGYLGTNDCVIYILDDKKKVLEQIAAYGQKINAKNEIENKITIPLGEGIVGKVALTGISEIINDTSCDKRYIVDDQQRLSEITVPIIYDDKVIGIIDSEHASKNYFNQKQLEILQSIASIVSMQLYSAINLREKQKIELKNRLLLDKLERSNDELQEYAHMVSHDLKSPLRSIDALISWIREDNQGKLDDITNKNFDLIESTLEKMENLIASVLEYSSIGYDGFDDREINLNNLLNEIGQIMLIPDHITLKILKELPIVMADSVQMQQLFQNLISNAIKYNDKENGLIEIDVKEYDEKFEFSVKDNGAGIDSKYHDKIFKIFHTLNNNKEATGVGLSIVKKIVSHYEGELWLESEKGMGTTFYFTLRK